MCGTDVPSRRAVRLQLYELPQYSVFRHRYNLRQKRNSRRVNPGLRITTPLCGYHTSLTQRGHSRIAASLSEGRVYPELYKLPRCHVFRHRYNLRQMRNGRRVNPGLRITTPLCGYHTSLTQRGHSHIAASLSEGRVYPERYQELA